MRQPRVRVVNALRITRVLLLAALMGARPMSAAEPPQQNLAAVWSRADDAMTTLKREMAQAPAARGGTASAFAELERALSDICGLRIESTEVAPVPPSGPVQAPTPPATGQAPTAPPSPDERALRERLTMQTHRPTPLEPTPSDARAEDEQRKACTEAMSALVEARGAAERGAAANEFGRLEAALARLRAVRP